MSVLQYLKEVLINEITADDKYNKFYDGKLDREIFDQALELDPTSNGNYKVGNYVDWLLKNKDSLDIIDSDKFSKMLSIFDKQKTKLDPDNRDINKMDIPKFISVMNKAEKDGILLSKKDKERARKKLAEENSEVVYNDDKHIVVVPKTMQASQYYAAGCAWCTGHQDDNVCYFDNDMYVNGDIYIIYDKKTRNKWQLFWEQGKDVGEYKDCKNIEFEPREEFKDTDLLNWINEQGFPEEHGDTYAAEEDQHENYEQALDDFMESIELPRILRTDQFFEFFGDNTNHSAQNYHPDISNIGFVKYDRGTLIDLFQFMKDIKAPAEAWQSVFPEFFSNDITKLEHFFNETANVEYYTDMLNTLIPELLEYVDSNVINAIYDIGFRLQDIITMLLNYNNDDVENFLTGGELHNADLYLALIEFINDGVLSEDELEDAITYLSNINLAHMWMVLIANNLVDPEDISMLYQFGRTIGKSKEDLIDELKNSKGFNINDIDSYEDRFLGKAY